MPKQYHDRCPKGLGKKMVTRIEEIIIIIIIIVVYYELSKRN